MHEIVIQIPDLIATDVYTIAFSKGNEEFFLLSLIIEHWSFLILRVSKLFTQNGVADCNVKSLGKGSREEARDCETGLKHNGISNFGISWLGEYTNL